MSMTRLEPVRIKQSAAALMLAVALLISVMPPGLCACWLNPAVKTVHVHFGKPPAGHSHDYLSDSADATAPIGIIQVLARIQSLILFALAGTIWTILKTAYPAGGSWSPPPLLPPPRAA
jgi:hypothetical protein